MWFSNRRKPQEGGILKGEISYSGRMKLVAQAALRIPIVNLPQSHNRDLWTVHLTILHITERIGIRGISDRNTVIKGYVSYRQMDFHPAKDRSR